MSDTINFHGFCPKDIFIEKSYDIINSISKAEVPTFQQKLLGKGIISLPEFKDCSTAADLHSYLLNKTPDQVEFFINELCNMAGKQGIRSGIEKLITEKKIERYGQQPEKSVEQPPPQGISVAPIPINRSTAQSRPFINHTYSEYQVKPRVIKVGQLSGLFCKDSGFVQHWRLVIPDVLGIPPLHFLPGERAVNSNPGELGPNVRNWVQMWRSSITGDKANIGYLVDKLMDFNETNNDELVRLVETLETRYDRETQIDP